MRNAGTTAAEGHPDTRPTFWKVFVSLRTFSLPVSVLPVFVATCVALPPSRWDWAVLLLSALAAAMLHLGGNLLNDYFDYRSGVDREMHDDTGRPGRLLVTGQLQPRMILVEAVVCLVIAAMIAASLVWHVGAGLLAFGAAALVLLYSYTGPPLQLKYRAMGEIVIFLAFGPLLMAGAAWAQLQRWDSAVLLLSIPVGMATTAVLVGNNYRDREEDAQGRAKTLAHFRNGRIARDLYLILTLGAAFLPAILAVVGIVPLTLLATPLATVAVVGSVRSVYGGKRIPDIDVKTARFAALLMVLIWAGFMAHWLGQR